MSESMWMWLAITSTLSAITSTATFFISWKLVKDMRQPEGVAVIMTDDPDG